VADDDSVGQQPPCVVEVDSEAADKLQPEEEEQDHVITLNDIDPPERRDSTYRSKEAANS
jgi:hypothetical protein